MKITILWVGKTTTEYIKDLIATYYNRIQHYMPIEILEVPDLKNTKSMDIDEQRSKEGKLIFQLIKSDDYLILLDDKGKQYTSKEFSSMIEKHNLNSLKRLVFVVGGAYGFSSEVYARANGFLSISKMTFSHQIIRPILFEQIYRAMTIIKGEPYHHEDSLWNFK